MWPAELRWSDFDFGANLEEGVAVDWPLRYRGNRPWYDQRGNFAGISGSHEGLAQLPDGQILRRWSLNCVEQDVAGRIKGALTRTGAG